MSASAYDDRIAWYENTAGDGTAWNTCNVTTTADGAQSVYAADVDGDGDTDLMSASLVDNKIAWYENTAGDGTAWTEHVISTTADGAISVCAADVDGDGDIDLMSASANDDKIRWYENLTIHRSACFPQQSVITTDAVEPTSVYAADVDGDGDTDLMSASYMNDKIAWYENTDGDGSAWNTCNVTTTADGASSVYAADVDGDGDIDLMSASYGDDRIAWYENTAGNGTAWNTCNVTTSANFAWSVYAADVDGDGDIDLMSASYDDDRIAWYENTDGDGSAWNTRNVTTTADGATSVYAADVDGDGDIDLMSASLVDDRIAWYENVNGDGLTWNTCNVTTTADSAHSVYAADVDGDGDIDLMSASHDDDRIAWYENTAGNGTAWNTCNVTTTADGAESVYAADVDGDGDSDVLSASENDDKIAWYENTAGDGLMLLA